MMEGAHCGLVSHRLQRGLVCVMLAQRPKSKLVRSIGRMDEVVFVRK